jgi:chromatin segregation and condensation protein Rec8/ScpA/Scc1 (kleisin family)
MSCLTNMIPETDAEKYQAQIELPRKSLMLKLDDYKDYDLSTQLLQTRENMCKFWTNSSIVLCKHVNIHTRVPFHKISLLLLFPSSTLALHKNTQRITICSNQT